MRNFAKLDTAPLNSPPSLFSVPCHPQTVKHHNENPLSCHPFPPKLLPTCENIGLQSRLRKNRTSDPSAPPILTGAPQTLPQPRPRHFPRRTLPTPKSHVIPPGPHSSTARKPRNINDLISKPETPSGELRAKLLSTCHGGTSRSPPRGLAAVPVGGGRARAGLEIDHSERSSRVAISRAGRRPPAHTAARPIQAGHAAAGDLAGRATPEIWRDHSHNRQRPGRLLHNSPHGSSPRRPRRISYDIRPVASHARSYRLG